MSTDKRVRPASDSESSDSESPADKQLRLESGSESDEAALIPLPDSSDEDWVVVGRVRDRIHRSHPPPPPSPPRSRSPLGTSATPTLPCGSHPTPLPRSTAAAPTAATSTASTAAPSSASAAPHSTLLGAVSHPEQAAARYAAASPATPRVVVPPTPGFETALDLAEALEEELGLRFQMRFLENGSVLVTPPSEEALRALMDTTWYYTEEVREANHRVNQARKLNRRVNTEATRGLLRAAVRRARETADRVQEEHWLAWCEGLDGCTSAAVLWRKLRAVAGGAVARPALHPQPQAEAERLVATFSSRAAFARLPAHTRDLLREANPGRVATFTEACLQAHATDAPIELWELERAIPRKDTATGVNRIPYSFLANAGPDMQAEVLALFNRSLELGALPASWKLATIVPIPKSGDGLQHRPISLLSCLGKCMERVLLPRLQWAMGPLHHHLFAFRRGRGTRDCISTLLSGVLERRAVVVFIDLEKAFELASAPAMLSILAERGVRGRLLAWVGHYLEGRRAAVRFQGHTSAIETFENGTPQGGVLSPVLFNLLVEKLTSLPTSGTARVLSYADDVALVVWGPNQVACARQLLRRLTQTCAALGLVVNWTKTKAMAFRHGHLPEPSTSRNSGWGWGQGVRSCIDYGTPCLLTVGPAALRPLETAQNAALRVIVGAPMWTKCVCLRAEARVCSVAARVTQLSVGHLAALLRCMGAEQLRASVGQALLQDPLLFRKRTWATVAAATIRSSGLPHALVTAVDAPHPTYVARPRWEPPALTATIRPLAKRKALLTPQELAREADSREREAAHPEASVYYTDGSVNHQTGAVGAAFVCGGVTAVFRLPDGCSSTQAELAAIGGALDHAVEGGRGPVLIHCDSVPAIRSLLQDPPRDNVSLLTSILARLAELRGAGRPVKVNWLLSHSGVAGNEAADGAAAEATLLSAVTRPVVVSLAQVKRDMAARSATGVVRELEEALAAGSPSAYWYSAATNTGARQLPPNLPRREASNIRRLRLGYKFEIS
ncbi:uncharacterized protein LOC126991544 [Eriocheir sinensis]|uniref:uncharacterized protein LOC126991544 n=1 Tax=Eriocheir sinensis TaxID=95602 RepID=UPI0021C83BC1|nr:uncharacterized protein LOC126991544 [Eriocheir sinensis]